MYRKFIPIFLLLISSTVLCAQTIKTSLGLTKFAQFDKVEVDIELKQGFVNPYRQEEIALDLIVRNPSGREQVLPCYFVSRIDKKLSNWKARYAPGEVGEYKCQVRLIKKGKIREMSKAFSFNVEPSSRNGFLHPNSIWTLRFDNGKLFRGVGENICWESRKNDDSKYSDSLHEYAKRYNYDYLLPEFAKYGGNFFRTWICSWNLPIDYKGPFNNDRYKESDEYYNPDALARLDHLVSLSEDLDLYIMLTIGQGGYTIKERGVVNNAEEFFIKKEARDWYKNRLRYIVARWGYSTSIAMWEFFNEVDNVQYGNKDNPIDGKVIVEWHDEMSEYLRSIDPYNHIITTSISHRDIDGLNSIHNIDINQKHIYNNTSSIPSVINKYVDEFHKPYIIGEFGREWDWSKNFDDFSDEMDIDFRRGLWYGLFSPTPVTPMSWWWEYFDARGMTSYYRAVREVSDRMLAAGGGLFEPLPVNAGKIQAYCVKCGEEIFLYLFNPEHSTFLDSIEIPVELGKKYNVVSIDPTTIIKKDIHELRYNSSSIVLDGVILGSEKEIVYMISPLDK